MEHDGRMKETISTYPVVATGANLAGEITDKRGFATRYGFSVRHVDNLLAQGLPHLKIGARRVRIIVSEGDTWMKNTYGIQRRAHAQKVSVKRNDKPVNGECVL